MTITRFKVQGRVQGVGFRAHTRRVAQEYFIGGWAINCSDGGVDILLIGETDAVASAKKQILQGPNNSRVDSVDNMELPSNLPDRFHFTVG